MGEPIHIPVFSFEQREIDNTLNTNRDTRMLNMQKTNIMGDVGLNLGDSIKQSTSPNIKQDLNSAGGKNIWTGTKSAMTYTKNFNHHGILKPNSGVPGRNDVIKTLGTPGALGNGFNDSQKRTIQMVAESTYEKLDGSVSYARNRITTKGTNSSAVPHGLMQDRVQANKAYKPKDGKVETWLDTIPKRKLNQGLTYLQKMNTQERKQQNGVPNTN